MAPANIGMRKNSLKVSALSDRTAMKDHLPFLVSDGKYGKKLSFDDPHKLLLESLIPLFGQLGVMTSSGTIGSNDEPRRSQAQSDDRTYDHDRDESYSVSTNTRRS